MRPGEDRKYYLFYCIGFVSLILTLKAAQLQLFSTKYKEQAQKTTLQKSLIYPSRGLIIDRNGKTLVYNKPIYVVYA
ncbi:MAG: hypothetical protein WBO36_17305, partial [Saprospiraceae bacterium]